jgi:hypothetical protein
MGVYMYIYMFDLFTYIHTYVCVCVCHSKHTYMQTFIKFNPETRTADMYADIDVATGEQVFETYGNKVCMYVYVCVCVCVL